MGKYEVIDAEFWPIKEGRSAAEVKKKRRRQYWAATGKFLALEAAVIAAAVAAGMLWR